VTLADMEAHYGCDCSGCGSNIAPTQPMFKIKKPAFKIKKPSFKIKKPSFNIKSSFNIKKPSFKIKKPSFKIKSSFNIKKPSFKIKKPSFKIKSSFNIKKPSFNAKHLVIDKKDRRTGQGVATGGSTSGGSTSGGSTSGGSTSGGSTSGGSTSGGSTSGELDMPMNNFCKDPSNFWPDYQPSGLYGATCLEISSGLLVDTNKTSWSDVTCDDIDEAPEPVQLPNGATVRLNETMHYDPMVGGCCGNGADPELGLSQNWSVTNVMCVEHELDMPMNNFCKDPSNFWPDYQPSGLYGFATCQEISDGMIFDSLSHTNKTSWSDVTCDDIDEAPEPVQLPNGATVRLNESMHYDPVFGGCCGNGADSQTNGLSQNWSVTNVMCVEHELDMPKGICVDQDDEVPSYTGDEEQKCSEKLCEYPYVRDVLCCATCTPTETCSYSDVIKSCEEQRGAYAWSCSRVQVQSKVCASCQREVENLFGEVKRLRALLPLPT